LETINSLDFSKGYQVGFDIASKIQKKEEIENLESLKEFLFKSYTDNWLKDCMDKRIEELKHGIA
jgi:hypothetical protein